MRKRRRLKSFVLPSLYALFIIGVICFTFFVSENMKKSEPEQIPPLNDVIVEKDIPVINEVTKIIKPFTNEQVKVGKSFYDYKSESESQENSIVYHNNTYMPNTGICYVLEGNEPFEVVSVLDGTVINVKEDEIMGKTIEIKHENDLITIYQSLSEASVKKGDVVSLGQVIGKSGKSKMDKDVDNLLHFEMYHKGKVVNPENYIGKEIDKLN